ncbi:ABC transporter ATP-binding protein [Pseudothermotoga thermarum]|uniref:Nucleoside ABC transporter ATP-binding protein n=1 Tax=Pseudothermotoga thermarum DSM 5069 TaxID=688269 RepID=F7YTR1_9THEM|nr:ABC transporter ATP-binding protein [Pseudothermotoga thermarum]AEH51290.1 nucleoside ABC transporter ATP-binding protein [Pseudothermotoga thermarum DSM 5069]
MVAIEAVNITKIYPNGVVANRNVNVQINVGEIHAIVGENGAGKTTLMKIFFGMEKPTSGEIKVFGKTVHFSSPKDAIKHGIGMVHQHFMLVPSFTVAENVMLGIAPKKGPFAVDFKKMEEIVLDYAKKLNFDVPVCEKVMDLPVGVKQRVEILKALVRGAKILILDEPSSVLTPQEVEELFQLLRKLSKEGITVIFITHKLNEVKQISDRITIMRNGHVVGTYKNQDVSETDIVELMIGRKVEYQIERTPAKPGKIVLEVKNLNYYREDGAHILKNVNFYVRGGEIFAIAGLEGNGQKELVEIITGLREKATGRILLNGVDILNKHPGEIRRLGLAHIPEDRVEVGSALDLSVAENLISDRYYQQPFSGKVIYRPSKVLAFAERMIKMFNIKAKSPSTSVRFLSGGNIQKTIVARETTSNCKIVIASQPTHGIDVASSEFIRKRLLQMRDEGKAVLLISTDLQEVLQISDRVAVLYKGEIVAHFANQNLSETELAHYMLGVKRQSWDYLKEHLT